jgi:uncharacterized protein YegJ (DUF2314 family)
MGSKGASVLLALVLAAGLAAGPAPGQTAAEKAERDELAVGSRDDPAMAEAFRKARATLSTFLALAAKPPPGTAGFAVKIGIREGGRTELVWVHPFAQDGDRFSGRLNNTPRMVGRVGAGDSVTFSPADIVDWMYIEGETMRGNFTACALLKGAATQERQAFRRRFGLDCGA